MAVTMEDIKKLRAMTGAGMMDVKKALEETGGDLERAATLLRERGIAKAAKKADREAREGFVGAYVHHNGKIATLVELNCETDFVARNEKFQELAKNIAIHIAMANPLYKSRDDVPSETVEAERKVLAEQARQEGKPEQVVAKMVEGRLGKFFAEVCLLEQPYIKDDKKTIEALLKEAVATMGENIQVGAFYRVAIGE
ncbi:translation elongation factor Ts [Truepera radiovictrix]|uniref:Elongation factor Ts n=1 Tax=Truepera radiovictrix (strain DSM 17093 / CIP 108686 / LMG 22925 / RQ-24) TaxID=649638 RepID=D7CV60_TRURR|nr:translation elongation factor Ts [Truepera radiovictrix]ADI15887.1 translation elongation factor Ts [Truepera radiovictrix DSM 17093]WMT58487.1 translation elongation factor Ts [Truepera radiovictrix]